MAHRSTQHRRLAADIVGSLAVGFDHFLAYAQEAGAITEVQAEDLWRRCGVALGEAAAAQGEHQDSSDPVLRFVELLSAAVASGRAHLADLEGNVPEDPAAWGWRQVTSGSNDHLGTEWRPLGTRIGWVQGEDLCLEADAAYAACQRLAQEQGDSLAVTLPTLKGSHGSQLPLDGYPADDNGGSPVGSQTGLMSREGSQEGEPTGSPPVAVNAHGGSLGSQNGAMGPTAGEGSDAWEEESL